MLTVFLPRSAWEIPGIRRSIEELVESIGATGYTLVPPSTGGWYSDRVWSLCQVHPLQIVAPDNRETFERFNKFTRGLARATHQRWIYALLMPVRVADRHGNWGMTHRADVDG
jgi:hypothetical protein